MNILSDMYYWTMRSPPNYGSYPHELTVHFRVEKRYIAYNTTSRQQHSHTILKMCFY